MRPTLKASASYGSYFVSARASEDKGRANPRGPLGRWGPQVLWPNGGFVALSDRVAAASWRPFATPSLPKM